MLSLFSMYSFLKDNTKMDLNEEEVEDEDGIYLA
jgi:hypothetical protein